MTDPEWTSQSQSRRVVPARWLGLSRRVAVLKRCISSSIFSTFSSRCMIAFFWRIISGQLVEHFRDREFIYFGQCQTPSAMRRRLIRKFSVVKLG
ncbi:MAG: hypothetical protein WB495_11705 [Xanthobacteraceae bacterium]